VPEPSLRIPWGPRLTTASEQTDDDLMRLARAGDTGAFGALVHRHQRLVLGLAVRFLDDRFAARDVAQDVFLSLWEDRARYQPRGRFRSYLVSATVHRCNTARRRELGRAKTLAALPAPPPADAQPGPEPTALRRLVERERDRDVRAKLRLVPERCRAVLVLRFGHGMTLEEVAAATGLPLGTVKSHLFRGLKRLQALLGGGS
jgi:RNA polymerase sigma factor (sigma-70 family)